MHHTFLRKGQQKPTTAGPTAVQLAALEVITQSRCTAVLQQYGIARDNDLEFRPGTQGDPAQIVGDGLARPDSPGLAVLKRLWQGHAQQRRPDEERRLRAER